MKFDKVIRYLLSCASRIPENTEICVHYETKNNIIIMGEPDDNSTHNCDQCGCGSLDHVILRIPKNRIDDVMEFLAKEATP